MASRVKPPSVIILKSLEGDAPIELEGQVIVGRASSCDVKLERGQLSREHARLSAGEGHILVEDLGSANGTFVNKIRVEKPTLARHGDVIHFDTLVYQVLVGTVRNPQGSGKTGATGTVKAASKSKTTSQTKAVGRSKTASQTKTASQPTATNKPSPISSKPKLVAKTEANSANESKTVPKVSPVTKPAVANQSNANADVTIHPKAVNQLKPVSKSAPAAKSISASKPVSADKSIPANKPMPVSSLELAAKPAAARELKPAVKPAIKPITKPTAKPAPKPTAAPSKVTQAKPNKAAQATLNKADQTKPNKATQAKAQVLASPKGWDKDDKKSVKRARMMPLDNSKKAALKRDAGAAEKASPGTPILVGLSGELKGKVFRFDTRNKHGKWDIGRDDACDIRLSDISVSNNHAQLILQGEQWRLIDLMSANGTFVNGNKGLASDLNSGDTVCFGQAEFVFKLRDANQIPDSDDAILRTESSKSARISPHFLVIGAVGIVAASAYFFLK